MNSPLATLESRTDTAAATAAPDVHLKGVHRITGQYIFDRFVGDHDGDQTRMGIVRYAVDNVDTDTFKKALKDAIEIASKHSDAAKKTMQNHQSVMRTAYGALKFAAPQCNMLGIDAKTGYQQMRVLGKQALEKAGRKWDGGKATTAQEKEAAKIDAAQASRLSEIRQDNPQNEGETPQAWEMRCRALLAAEMTENEGEGMEKLMARAALAELVEKTRKLCGGQLQDVIAAILNDPACEFDINIG